MEPVVYDDVYVDQDLDVYDDRDYGDEYPPSEGEYIEDAELPDVVRHFLESFYQYFRDRNTYELNRCYDYEFTHLSEHYYRAHSTWPSAETVAPYVDNDAVFLTFYKELYYRYLHSRSTLTLQDRHQSFQNYLALFDIILTQTDNVEFELPSQWMWDMIDEFVYQFEVFCNFRDQVTTLTEEEITFLQENPSIWSAPQVLRTLNALVNKSKIRQTKNLEEKEEETGAAMFRTFGNFALIGLLRVHCQLGDYTTALRVLEPINLKKRNMSVPCHVSMYYLMSFAYLMSRRYLDAIGSLNMVLGWISRNKVSNRLSQFDSLDKKELRLYSLLAIAVSLCPQRLDETLLTSLRDKLGDKWAKLQKGEEETYLEVFQTACPKFVNPASPNYANKVDVSKDALNLQTKIFMNEVRDRLSLNNIFSFVKLYSSIGLAKLAKFLELEQYNLLTRLFTLKHKNRYMKWQGGAPASGEWETSGELNFCLDKAMVHISETKVARRFGGYFLRNLSKFQEMLGDIQRIH
eukprot:TRINITY_DN2993_c0_g3_i1.p1 TRINITY_DN2993_c0_g3~~TRINITY_DN2993_c0_g3_i1.p1  ORF type:complete len:518 (+),score=198.25 TRINITY_DN2993_c0_g3_i1:58-1611(+)